MENTSSCVTAQRVFRELTARRLIVTDGRRGSKFTRRTDATTVFVCTNDRRALHVDDYCAQHGIRIPEQIAVTGFDNMHYRIIAALTAISLSSGILQAANLTLVKDGKPQTAIWYSEDTEKFGDRQTAEELASIVKQMSGADLEIKTAQKDGKPAAGTPAIIVGALAKQMGIAAPPKTPSGDGYRLQLKGNHLLMAGKNANSTYFASTHLLEYFGCRWFIDNDIGTVIPSLKTLVVEKMDVVEHPDFISRAIWGPNWGSGGVWGRRNRTGGMALPVSHNWPRFFCTTDPQVRADYLAYVVERIKGKGSIAKFYTGWREAVNRCDFAAFQKLYDALVANMEAIYAAKIHPIKEYRLGYAPRFLVSNTVPEYTFVFFW